MGDNIALEKMECGQCVQGWILDEFANKVSCPKCRGVGHFNYRITEPEIMAIVEALEKGGQVQCGDIPLRGKEADDILMLNEKALSILMKE